MNKNITLPINTNLNINNVATTKAFKKSLQTANPTLTDNDLTYMNLTAPELSPGDFTTVKITIIIGETSAISNVNVIVIPTDANKAVAVFNKFAIRTITLPAGTSPYINSSATTKLFKETLQLENPALSDDDLTHLSLASQKLTPGVRATDRVTITFGDISTYRDINVTLLPTDQQKVDAVLSIKWLLLI